ncbi:MAG TPA: T9SS type A sorting domain-containing protein, partial [Candidatus Edwardsbacteria bacterium]|nr:T9SS type A sorting domain-containing protein [Candidatus Edwardsbacteria bacterium]
TIPLGVSGKRTDQQSTARIKISFKAWPNPASNVIHFACNLPNTQNSSVSIYDIAGRLVKTLAISDHQINWDCADCMGRKVASGVYFARLNSAGQETIKRISIIK